MAKKRKTKAATKKAAKKKPIKKGTGGTGARIRATRGTGARRK
jgi:hypothetical protein